MENKPAQNIQDSFLNTARKERTSITIYLLSGVKLSGRIRSFDKYSVVLETNNQEQLIFKHAISTVVMAKSMGGAVYAGDREPRNDVRPAPASPGATAGSSSGSSTATRAPTDARAHTDESGAEESLAELRELARSAGAEVAGEFVQRRDRPDPATLIGRGKLEELSGAVAANNANVVLFDHELTPSQQRN